MNIIRLQPDITGTVAWPTLSASKKSVVTVGVFDGVHRGHQSVIKETVRIAKREKCFSVVIMFDPRPAFVHVYAAKNGGMEPTSDVQDTQKITGVDERLRMMNALHVDYVLIVRYDLEFAAKSFRFFLGQLVGKLGMRTLVLGEDARMGANLEGTVESIGRLAEGTGVFELVVVPDHGGHVFVPQQAAPHMPEGRGEPADPFEGLNKAEQRALTKRLNSKKVRVLSSTNVRWLLGQGRIMAANDVLGHTHGVEGTVVHGEERGRTIGSPRRTWRRQSTAICPSTAYTPAGSSTWAPPMSTTSRSVHTARRPKPAPSRSRSSTRRAAWRTGSPNIRRTAGRRRSRSAANPRSTSRAGMTSACSKPMRSPTTGSNCMGTVCAANSWDSCARKSNSIRRTIWWPNSSAMRTRRGNSLRALREPHGLQCVLE